MWCSDPVGLFEDYDISFILFNLGRHKTLRFSLGVLFLCY